MPASLTSSFLNLVKGIFLILLLSVYHRKIYAEGKMRDCFDLNMLFIVVCSSRKIVLGYSLLLTWLGLIFTILNGICLFQITKIQKLIFLHGLNGLNAGFS